MVNFNTYYFPFHGQSKNSNISTKQGKAEFLVLDFTWKVFTQTGNIETYLLLKELENAGQLDERTEENNQLEQSDGEISYEN